MVTTVRMTAQELDILDWLMRRCQLESRSQALRFALVEVARQQGISSGEMSKIKDERQIHPPRRSAKIARLVGQRKNGAKFTGGDY